MEAEEITTYQDMNEKIVDILKFQGSNYCLYAAKRIMELEGEVKKLSLNLHVMRSVCDNCGKTER